MSTTNDHQTESGGTERKSVLVCPVCGWADHIDGDWAVTEYDVGGTRRRVYQCPDCWETVVSQPVFDGRVPLTA